MSMADCKCCKNLFGFAASRPPCFVFTVCLGAFAIGLFSLGYFVQLYGWIDDVDENQNKDWHSFLNHLGSSEFCIFGNQSFFQNSTYTNSTNITGHAPAGYATLHIPQLDLSLRPSDGFEGMVDNVTYITTTMMAKELGLSGLQSSDFFVNVTLTLRQPWSMDCQEEKCKQVFLETCGSVTIPTDVIPQQLLSRNPPPCNVSSDINIIEMVNIEKFRATLFPVDEQCVDGIWASTSVQLTDHFDPTRIISLVDASAVNLRLQYSSYFLFVLVITCVLYGMIKGRPSKQGFSKKSMLAI